MTIRYVWSGATGAANGTTWADAYTTLGAAATASAAGDTIYVAHDHAESTAGAVTITFPTTNASPVRAICADRSAEPPTATATTAVIAATGASGDISILGDFWLYGLQFESGAGGAHNTTLRIGNTNGTRGYAESCRFSLETTAANRGIQLCGSSGTGVRSFQSCTFEFGAVGQILYSNVANCVVLNSTVAGAAITNIISTIVGGSYLFSGCDFSAAAPGVVLLVNSSGGRVDFANCKLPASWSGQVIGSANNELLSATMTATDSAGNVVRAQRAQYVGTLVSETTIVRDGGAATAWKVTTNANAQYAIPFDTQHMVRWNDTTGSAVTARVEILRDSATDLTSADIWLEVMYYSESGSPLGTWTSNRAGLLSSGTDHANSAASWTTTGMSNPNPQTLSVTFTPQLAGYVQARVCVAKASTTVYVDPQIELT